MKLLSLEPESSASANSATSANMMSTSGIISQRLRFVKGFAKKCKEGKDLLGSEIRLDPQTIFRRAGIVHGVPDGEE